MTAERGLTISRTLNDLAYTLGTIATDIGTVAATDRIPIYDTSAQLVGYTTSTGLAADAVDDDPFNFGVETPNVTRWTQTIFPSENEAEADRAITVAQRTTRLQAIIAKAVEEKKEIVIPTASTYYETNDELSLSGAKGLSIHLEGEIRNTQTDASEGGIHRRVFGTGNYHPVYFNEDTGGITWYLVDTYAAGTDTIVLTSGSNRTNGLAALTAAGVGAPVFVRSRQFNLANTNGNGKVADFLTLAHIVSITSTGIVIDSALVEVPANIIVGLANNAALDIAGDPLYVADSVKIIGPGTIHSLNGAAFLRTGMIDCTVDVGEIRAGTSPLPINLAARSLLKAERLFGTAKIIELSCNTHDSRFIGGYAEIIGAGSGNALLKIGECSRDSFIHLDVLKAGKYTSGDGNSGLLTAGDFRRVTLEIENAYAPLAPGAGFNISSSIETDAGVGYCVQPVTHDLTLRLGKIYLGSGSRYVYAADLAGATERLRLERGQFFGTVSTEAIEISGGDHFIGPVECADGSLNVVAGTSRLTVRGAFFDEGVVYEGGVTPTIDRLFDHNLGGLRSTSYGLFKAGGIRNVLSAASSTTTANNAALTSTFAAGSFLAGDTVNIKVYGRVEGTADVKTIQITDDTGALLTLPLLAAQVGAYDLDLDISLNSLAAYRGTGTARFDAATAIITKRTSRTALDLTANSRTFNIERWVANAADSITVDFAAITPVRLGHE